MLLLWAVSLQHDDDHGSPFFRFWKTCSAILIRNRISVSDFPSSIQTFPWYFNFLGFSIHTLYSASWSVPFTDNSTLQIDDLSFFFCILFTKFSHSSCCDMPASSVNHVIYINYVIEFVPTNNKSWHDINFLNICLI